MICNPGLKVKSIPVCSLAIVIGAIKDAGIAVMVYIKDITTGLVIGIQSESNSSKIVTVDISNYEFAQNHSYQLWITKANVSQDAKETVTIGTSSDETINIRFEDISENGEPFSLPSITLEAA